MQETCREIVIEPATTISVQFFNFLDHLLYIIIGLETVWILYMDWWRDSSFKRSYETLSVFRFHLDIFRCFDCCSIDSKDLQQEKSTKVSKKSNSSSIQNQRKDLLTLETTDLNRPSIVDIKVQWLHWYWNYDCLAWNSNV